MAARPAPRPKSKSAGKHPGGQHKSSSQTPQRRLSETKKWNKGPVEE